MTSPCQEGQCPQLEITRLQMYRDISEQIATALTPHIDKIEQFSIELAVHAEKMSTGGKKFAEQKERIDGVGEKVDKLEKWKATEVGADTKIAKVMAGFALLLTIVVPVVTAFLF